MPDTLIDYACKPKADLGGGDARAGSEALLALLRAGDEAALAPHVGPCTNCPANARRLPFGCAGPFPDPFPRAAARWLLDRAEPPDRIGGAVGLQFLEDAGGPPAGRVERGESLERELPASAFKRAKLTADELLYPLASAGGRLAPWQQLAFLLWVGGVKLDDAIPKTAADALTLTRLEPSDRPKRAKLALGSADEGAEPARELLKALFVAWARDADVRVG